MADRCAYRSEPSTDETIFAGLGAPRWEGMTLVALVALPQGLVREELVSTSERIAQAFSAIRASVFGQQIGALQLHLEFVDALEQPFASPLGGSSSGVEETHAQVERTN